MTTFEKNNDIGGAGTAHLCVNADTLTSKSVPALLMEVLEFIKAHRIPQKALAEKMDMSYYMFRKKVSGTQVEFSEEEIEQLRLQVVEYLEDLLSKFHKNVKKKG